MRRLNIRTTYVGVIAVFLGCPLLGHEGNHERIDALTLRISEASPSASGGLFLRRGELYAAHRDWEAALKDVARARALGADRTGVDLCAARSLLGARRQTEALAVLEPLLERQPSLTKAWLFRAQAFQELGRVDAAIQAYTRCIEEGKRHGKPQIEVYLVRARLQSARGLSHFDDALIGLDEGLREIGNLASLQLFAIELELRRKRHDAALKRLDDLSRGRRRQERWLARRAEILEAAGRCDEAREAYEAALQAIATLPASRQRTRLVEAVRGQALARIDALNEESPTGGIDE